MRAPDPARTERMLVDPYGRHVSDLRVSLTDRCNFRCVYCHNEGLGDTRGPAEPSADEMTGDEVVRLLRIAREFDISRVKLTGGEPLLRRDLESIVARVSPFMEVSLTTNGSLLAGRAQALADAGLARVNISIDTLDARHFRAVRRGSLEPVLAGLEAALACGLAPVKINTVVMDDTLGELPELVDFVAQREGLELQLIEVMPEIRSDMAERRADLERVRGWLAERTAAVSQRSMHHRNVYLLENGARVELVDPVGNAEFCANCHRVRVTHDGQLKGCLNRLDDYVPTRGLDDDGVRDAFRRVVAERAPYYGVLHRGVAVADDPKRLYASLRRPVAR
ncbi:MAG TPA: GTP 3',8-cyclase MoaA [Candidatus Thermoplasmatota archaeon]|nr:GTP 3',8-cyclase MoaA [Candidatus Thermoplasmatota archaeon]